MNDYNVWFYVDDWNVSGCIEVEAKSNYDAVRLATIKLKMLLTESFGISDVEDD